MTPQDEQKIRAMIDQAVRPVAAKLERLEKDVRRLKSDVQQTKNAVNRIKR